jgi:pimeloyl-ACP methyl ester carboxylesterase
MHIQDVTNVLEYENLSRVVLVGHSYAGMVITGAADRAPGRIAHLVYLDAAVPAPGASLFDGFSKDAQGLIELEATGGGDPTRWPMPEGDALTDFNIAGLTDDDIAWLRRRGTPHPLATFRQPLHVSNPARDELPRTYILCSANQIHFPEFVRRARIDPSWRFRELPTGHWPMVSMPREVSLLLREAAR